MCVCVCGSGEACWWTVHPASRQRSEGEKVRAGDDLILVNVSSERYLASEGFSSVDDKESALNFSVQCQVQRNSKLLIKHLKLVN